jgi:hypothetical protein
VQQQQQQQRRRNTSRPAADVELGSTTIDQQPLDRSSDAKDVVVGDYSSPASNTRSKATTLPMSYYDERDADEDSEESYLFKSDDGSDDDDEEDSHAGVGEYHGTYFLVYSIQFYILRYILKIRFIFQLIYIF